MRHCWFFSFIKYYVSDFSRHKRKKIFRLLHILKYYMFQINKQDVNSYVSRLIYDLELMKSYHSYAWNLRGIILERGHEMKTLRIRLSDQSCRHGEKQRNMSTKFAFVIFYAVQKTVDYHFHLQKFIVANEVKNVTRFSSTFLHVKTSSFTINFNFYSIDHLTHIPIRVRIYYQHI